MDTDELRERAGSFAQGASAYERLRPDYPKDLFDDIFALAGSRMLGTVLEIGAGTGRATLPLARRGATIQVVDPSADMLRVLRERLKAEHLADHVSARQATFEELDATLVCDVVVAAQSFHWADPATRWSRLAALLGASGVAFLFWNGWHFDPRHHDQVAVAEVYAACGGTLESDVDDHRSGVSWAEDELDQEPALTLSATRTYHWDHTLPIEDYLGLLSTTSQYAVAPTLSRDRPFGPLAATLGSTVHLRGRTLMLVVQRPPVAQDRRTPS